MLSKIFLKKIIFFTAFLASSLIVAGERFKSNTPYSTLGSYSDNSVAIQRLIALIRRLEINKGDDIIQEYQRNSELSNRYLELCGQLRTRGTKQNHDKFQSKAQLRSQEASRLKKQMDAEIDRLNDEIFNILADATLPKPVRWIRTRTHHERIAALIINKDSKAYQDTINMLEFIEKKQKIVDQLDLIDKLQAENNKDGMVAAYRTLLTATDSSLSHVEIHSRITDLEKQIQEECMRDEVTYTINAMRVEDSSSTQRYEKIVDFCQRTLASNSDTVVQEVCKSQRLKYKKLLAFKEMIATPTINDNEFLYNTYRSMINESDSIGINDIRDMILHENENTTRETSFDTNELTNAAVTAIQMLENILNSSQEKKDEKVTAALEEVNNNNKPHSLVTLANAYHQRAEFNQKYYSKTHQTLIERDRYDARSRGLQAIGKNKALKDKLIFEL